MSTINRFEDLEIWQISRQLRKEISKISQREIFKTDLRFKSQIRSASGSVMHNIAEGFEREGNAEFKQFLYIAKASAGEVRSQLYCALEDEFISQEEYESLKSQYETLSIKIKNFITYLQNSELKGNKYK